MNPGMFLNHIIESLTVKENIVTAIVTRVVTVLLCYGNDGDLPASLVCFSKTIIAFKEPEIGVQLSHNLRDTQGLLKGLW